MSTRRGRLIVLEGPEGVGKSTQLELLQGWLIQSGISPLTVREPGGTEFGELVRQTVLGLSTSLSPSAEALLFMASRAELVTSIVRPALNRGELVLADRFFLSTYAYQIYGRRLPVTSIRWANALASGGIIPDLTIVLRLRPVERQRRLYARGGWDRMDSAGGAFHARVESAFTQFLSKRWQATFPECGPIVGVNGEGDPLQVRDRIATLVVRMWPNWFRLRSRQR